MQKVAQGKLIAINPVLLFTCKISGIHILLALSVRRKDVECSQK